MQFSNSSARAIQQGAFSLTDLVKVLAAQIILWHHFSLYGPLSELTNPLLGVVSHGLVDYGRLAVQVFLVCSGFLAAPLLLRPPVNDNWNAVAGRLGTRYRRLVQPYAIALLAAILAAAFARVAAPHPTTPEAPQFIQVLSHLLLLQDIIGSEALSSGVWYVAIDLQLFALLTLIVHFGRRQAIPMSAALALLSLFWINRQSGLDMWALYFFGSYGMGILARWIAEDKQRRIWILALVAVAIAALLVEWRSRIAVSATISILLAGTGGRLSIKSGLRETLARLSRESYALFLIHYPVLMMVGALVDRRWPGQPLAAGLGLLTAWGLAMLAARALHLYVETPALKQAKRLI